MTFGILFSSQTTNDWLLCPFASMENWQCVGAADKNARLKDCDFALDLPSMVDFILGNMMNGVVFFGRF